MKPARRSFRAWRAWRSGRLLAGLGLSLAACSQPDPEQERIEPAGCRLAEAAAPQAAIGLVRVLRGATVSAPVQMIPAPGDAARVYLVSQTGRIYVAGAVTESGGAEPWLDLTAGKGLEYGGEKGLLGLAFAPDFAQSGRLYVNYTRRQAGKLQTVISRFTANVAASAPPSPASEQILLTVDQPYDNHNGGQLAFGPDGFLYIGLGDGGSAGDPQNAGQRLDTLLAKILRIDVGTTDASYRVPADNPFVGQAGRRGEIWAYGLRNPWRFSFDPVTGALWAADVGQNAVEEIDLIARGKNYGWRITEGDRCYSPMTGCDRTGLEPPVFAYPQSEGKSVTGGFVYRGTALPSLQGTYVFGDYVAGSIWGLKADDGGTYRRTLLVDSGLKLSAFGLDGSGELYAVDYGAGAFYRFTAATGAGTGGADPPALLSATGCFDDVASRRLARGVVSYGVNAPLWSDGADKERGLSLPPGGRLGFTADGAWQVPSGTVLIKTFLLSGRPVETRLLLRTGDRIRGFSYRWRDDLRDAELLPDARTETVSGQSWYYPSRSDCLVCHTDAAGQVLGLQTAQLNRAHDLFGTGHAQNQIEALGRLGYAGGVPAGSADGLARFPDPGDAGAPLAARTRAYLSANCAHCHQPGGLAVGTIDLRPGLGLGATRTCGVAPSQGDLGVPGALIVAPGEPARSTLLLRMQTTDPAVRMPNVATSVPDPAGTALLRDYIAALPMSCGEPD